MTAGQAMDAVHNGQRVTCTREEYLPVAGLGIRDALQLYAAQRLEVGDTGRSMRAVEEVCRLDLLFDYDLEEGAEEW